MHVSRFLLSAAFVTGVVGSACGGKEDLDADVDSASRTIAEAYCEGMVPCCERTGARVGRAACVANAKARVALELRDSLQGGGSYDETQLAGCAEEVRSRAAQCVQNDNSYVRGITKTATLFACDNLARFGGMDCPCPASWECYPGTSLHGMTSGPHCIPPYRGYPCHAPESGCSTGTRCVVDACDDAKGPRAFTGYEVTAATCSTL